MSGGFYNCLDVLLCCCLLQWAHFSYLIVIMKNIWCVPSKCFQSIFKKVGSWFNFPIWGNCAGCFLVVLLKRRLLPQRFVWSLTLLPDTSHAAWITTQLGPFDLWPPAAALHLIFLSAVQWHPQIGPVRETRVDRVLRPNLMGRINVYDLSSVQASVW